MAQERPPDFVTPPAPAVDQPLALREVAAVRSTAARGRMNDRLVALAALIAVIGGALLIAHLFTDGNAQNEWQERDTTTRSFSEDVAEAFRLGRSDEVASKVRELTAYCWAISEDNPRPSYANFGRAYDRCESTGVIIDPPPQ